MSDPKKYTVGWISAIVTEYVAAQQFLEERHEGPKRVHQKDENHYTLGRIGKHNIVIAVLPQGDNGVAAAAMAAKDMMHTFPNVRVGLMVGIGGGVPSKEHDIRLGDVVISTPSYYGEIGNNGGVVQYDYAQTMQKKRFQSARYLNQPPRALRAAVAGLRARHINSGGNQIDDTIRKLLQRAPQLQEEFSRPDPTSDRLYSSEIIQLERATRRDNTAVHYGLIASADHFMEDASVRDILAKELDVLCFEMEAAGLMNQFPCLIIRGICDYSDTQWSKEWRGFAALAAAAYAKDLLYEVAPMQLEAEEGIGELLYQNFENLQNEITITREEVQSTRTAVFDASLETVLSRLPIADGAAFDTSADEHEATCFSGTRVDLLARILNWADETDSKCIYWLQGMAGTGKSTISRTVADKLAKKGALGASFFFKRGGSDRGKSMRFFTTVVAQLVCHDYSLAKRVGAAIQADSRITEKVMREQFEKLVLQPLKAIEADLKTPKTMVVVVDALDECDREGDAQTLIGLLPRLEQLASVRLKFFVTSRPEFPIRSQFDEISGAYQGLVLQDVPDSIMENDISRFLADRLAKIREKEVYQLPTDWPDQTKFQTLVRMAIPLFIVAETSCRFIEDKRYGGGGPDGRLSKILINQANGHTTTLNDMYLLVLTASVKDEAIDEFRDVVGSIISLANPLSRGTLALLLDIPSIIIDERLDSLHSVLSISSDHDAPIQLLHLSFRSFLINRDNHKTDPFWIDAEKIHDKLATRCLHLLMNNDYLKMDICGLEAPGASREDVDRQKINRCLPPEIQYACLYWVYHIKGSGTKLHDRHQALQFFQQYFLHWLEALSLIGRISDSIKLVDELQALVDLDNGAEVSRFLHDAKRFILNCRSAIDQAPLQVYSSALVFAPEKSVIREMFLEHIRWITTKPILERNWNPCLQTLEGHRDSVLSVTFSADGRLLASASDDMTVKVWDVSTGALQYTLEGHDGRVLSVTFSTNSRLLISGSEDKKIKIWDAETELLQHTLEGHRDRVTSIALSADSRQLASGSDDETVRIWDMAAGTLQYIFEGHYGWVASIAFSANGRQLASASYDETVKIWDIATRQLQCSLEGHRGWVLSVAFSANSRMLASASDDGTIKVWSAATGALQRTLEGHNGRVRSVTFSADGKLLASASFDGTVKIWDAVTGVLQCTFEGHCHKVFSVAFSPDSKLLASASDDRTIKIWDIMTRALQYILNRHDSGVTSIVFSANEKQLASASYDGTIKIWDVATGALEFTVKGHRFKVTSVVFSADGRLLASASNDGTVKIWDITTRVLQHTLEGHRGWILSIIFSANSRLLASALDDGTIKIWDTSTGALQPTDTAPDIGQLRALVRTCSGAQLQAQASESPQARGYNLSPDKLWIRWNRHNALWLPPNYRPSALAISPSTSTIALGCSSGMVLVIGFS